MSPRKGKRKALSPEARERQIHIEATVLAKYEADYDRHRNAKLRQKNAAL